MDSKTQGIYNGQILDDYCGTDSDVFNSNGALEYRDEVENLTQEYLSNLAKIAGVEELEWDIALIYDVLEPATESLKKRGIPVWDPHVSDAE